MKLSLICIHFWNPYFAVWFLHEHFAATCMILLLFFKIFVPVFFWTCVIIILLSPCCISLSLCNLTNVFSKSASFHSDLAHNSYYVCFSHELWHIKHVSDKTHVTCNCRPWIASFIMFKFPSGQTVSWWRLYICYIYLHDCNK